MRNVTPFRVSRVGMRWAVVVLAGCASTTAPAPAVAMPIATAQAPASAAGPDGGERLITALVAEDFAAVVAELEPASAPPTAAQVAATWRAHARGLGAPRRWSLSDRTFQDGFEVRSVRVELERGAVQCFVAVDPASRRPRSLFVTRPAPPAAYVDRAKFREVAVRLGTPPYELEGTLALPTGDGPFPAAVLVHGSGPNDRDNSVGAIKMFADLAEGLATSGVAVLRYDKRTYTYRDRLDNSISLDDEAVLDAIAAVRTVAAHAAVDPTRVVVIGHSLGGLLAPEIAVRAGGVAGVALLAPPGRPPWEIVREQMRYLGAPRDTLAHAERAVIELALGSEHGQLAGMPYSYWRDWARRDGIAMSKQLGRRVLVLRGTRDYQVTAADFATWQAGLRDAPLARFTTLPHLNHLFIAGRGAPNPLEYRVPAHVDASVIATLATFVAEPGQ